MLNILPKVGRYGNMSTIVASCDDWRRQLFATRCFSCHVRLRDVDDGDADCDDDDDVGNDNDNGDGNCLFHAASLAMCVAVMVAMMTMMVMMII